MRASLVLFAVLVAGFALALPGEAQQFTTAQTSAVGMSGKPGSFVSGFTPVNLVNKPLNVGTAMRPTNFQNAAMPRPQSPRVFNINSAFSKFEMPLFRSTKPNVPIVQPGTANPIQPSAIPPLKPAPQSTQPKLKGVLGFGG